MGLDMYSCKMKRPSEEEVKKIAEYSAYYFHNICYIPDNTIKKDYELYADILPYCVPVTLDDSSRDYDSIKKDFGITPNASLFCFQKVDGGVCLSFFNSLNKGEESKDITLTDEEWNSYERWIPTPFHVCLDEEVGYWRKDYDLDDAICNLYEWYKRDNVPMVLDMVPCLPMLEGKWTYDEDGHVVLPAGFCKKEELPEIQEYFRTVAKGIKDPDLGLADIMDVLDTCNRFGSDIFKDSALCVENCGYHHMTPAMAYIIDEVSSSNAHTLAYQNLAEDETLVYHIWF